MKLFPFSIFASTATGDYQAPVTDQQFEWMPEDGQPAGDEPLTLPDSENPYLPDEALTDEVPS